MKTFNSCSKNLGFLLKVTKICNVFWSYENLHFFITILQKYMKIDDFFGISEIYDFFGFYENLRFFGIYEIYDFSGFTKFMKIFDFFGIYEIHENLRLCH